MNVRRRSWTLASIAMIPALLLTVTLPGLPAAARQAGDPPATSAKPAPPARAPLAPAEEVTLNPVADSTIAQGSPNLGGDSLLWLQMGNMSARSARYANPGSPTQNPAGVAWTPTQSALLRFDLGLPANAVIDTAILRLKVNWPPGLDYVVVGAYQVTSDWSEMDVTWSSRPSLGSRYAQANVGPVSWYAWDVTEIARAWQQGPNYGLQLEPDWPTESVWSLAFLSQEGGLDPPRLVVTYHLPNATLYAPPDGRPGAELPVAGQNYTPGAAITLQLERGAGSWPCGSAGADASGVLRSRCTVPLTMPLGAATLGAYTAGGTLLASAAVQIVAGPALQLSTASGPPGTVVQYTAANLVAGSLRLDYAGVPIVGPLPVTGGSAGGSFVVPADRPSPLGSATVVRAANIAGGLAAGAAEVGFQSQPSTAPLEFQFTSASASGAHLAPGEVFTVTGHINPDAGAAFQGYQVLAMWQDRAGHAIPISLQPGTVGADELFQVRARAPSLRLGDAWSSAGSGEGLHLTLYKPGYEPSADFSMQYTGSFSLALQVRVISSEDGHEIENAVVRIEDYGGLKPQTREETNQLGGWAKAQFGDLALKNYLCSKPWAQETTPAGNALVQLPHAEALEVNPWYGDLEADVFEKAPALSGLAVSATASQGSKEAAPVAPPPQNPPTGSQWKHKMIRVNALLAGFGLLGEDGQWNGYSADVYFNTQTGEVVDAWSHALGNPFEVVLDPIIPAGAIPFKFSPVLTAGIPEPGTDPTIYGKFLSFAGLTSGLVTLPTDLTNIQFAIPWILNDYVEKVRVELAGQVVIEAPPLQYPTAGMCSTSDPQIGEWGLYDLKIPYPALAAGIHELKVIVRLTTGAEVPRLLKLRFVDAPAWFRTSAAGRRWAEWKGGGYELREELIGPDVASLDASSTAENTPKSGAITNKATLKSVHTEQIGFGGDATGAAEYSATGMKVLNQTAPNVMGKAQAGQPTALASVRAASSPDSNYTIPLNYYEKLFDTGTLPLMQGALNLLDIVEVTVGARGGSSAWLGVQGSVTVGNGAQTIDLTMKPEASVWGTYSLGVSFLTVVAAAKAELSADLNSQLALHVHDYDVGLDGVCFTYQGGTRFWAGLACVPYTEICLLEGETVDQWPTFKAPDGCTGTTQSTAAAAPQASQTPGPPTVGAALASDGFGHSAAIWPGSRSALTAQFFDGVVWGKAHTITTGIGPDAPALAFFAPDRAVAAWSESSLSDAETPLPTSAYTDVVRSYHIATSVWDGSGWSAPQDLTLPTTPATGEGRVALAACPSTAAGCPPGGAATAVWVRDMAGLPAQRQFRLFYAKYQGGHWSAPLPVDPSSTGADMQPSIAYRQGKPVVAWVRDADRSVATVADRRIAWRVLDGSSPVVVPSGLPEGIVYLALAIDGAGVPQLAFTRVDAPGVALIDARHPLHYAREACAGVTCVWSWQKLLDSHGRAIYAEQPRLTIDKLDRPTVTYRALGLGLDPAASLLAYPEDTAGVIAHTGDLAQVELPAVSTGQTFEVSQDLEGLNPQTAAVSPNYLTSDGAVNWEPLAVYDALSDSTLALAVRGTAPASAASMAAQLQKTNIAQALAAGEPIVAANVPRLPDFAVVTATVSSRYPAPSQPLTLMVALRNDGVGWQSTPGRTLSLAATWDGGPGLGTEAASTTVAALDAGQVVTLTLPLAAPPPVSPGAPAATYAAPHTLTVTANPNQAVAERSGANNDVTLPVGGLPVPQELAAAATGSAGVLLHWTAPTAGAVAGYRVYRSADGGPSLPAGSSLVTGWVDVTAQPGHSYRYTVVSYAANGLEGEPSEARQVTVRPAMRPTFLPLALRNR